MKHIERVKRHHYNMGAMAGIGLVCCLGILIAAFWALPWLVPLVMITGLILMFKEDYHMNWIRKFLGNGTVSAKLDALASYLGVEFTLVPEHWKVNKIKKVR